VNPCRMVFLASGARKKLENRIKQKDVPSDSDQLFRIIRN
jgi:hypothetical protein